MPFLLDTNILSAHFRGIGSLTHRLVQHGGQLYTSSIVIAELYAGASLSSDSVARSQDVDQLKRTIGVISFGENEARVFGQLRGELRPRGVVVSPIDSLIASCALGNQMTLVTHNVRHFSVIPGLHVVDWLEK